jgi:hypothetical protein
MKQITLLTLLLVSTVAFGQKKYEDAMKRNLPMLDTAQAGATLQMLSNSFERIGNAEKDKWLPFYYAAYASTRLVYVTEDKTLIDGILDKAQQFIDKADSLEPNNSEIVTVKSFILSARIMVNPMTRGAQYGPQSGVVLDKAMQLDPGNPRPYLLKGTGAFYTPAAFGGGKDKAIPLFETALEKYKTFKPKDELSPDWGEERTKTLLEEARK